MMAVAGFAAMGGMMWTQVIAPRDAVGYPAGAAVSYGSNPVFSEGGHLSMLTAGSTTLGLGSSSYDAIITDVVLTVGFPNTCEHLMDVQLVSGSDTLAQFETVLGSAGAVPIAAHYVSGIRVPAGSSLSLDTTIYRDSCGSGDARIGYSISGYYAEP